MFTLRTLRLVCLLAVSGLAIGSCINPPDYPNTPEIEFKSISKQRLDNRFGLYDTVTININYKDGDGDLGLRQADTLPPFNYYRRQAGKTPKINFDAYNYLCKLQIEKNGVFKDYINPNDSIGLNGRYPRLTPEEQGDRAAPLKGSISYGLVVFKGSPPEIQTGTVIRYRISIRDRALRTSNEIFTDPVRIE
ncbi:hypothetical protein ACFPAF_14180 [Hymenobacter endophyticus]|uniref:DUF3823 domain-containing protein n=1 Tax=Hymenobacter endophyticus TaxID=3076335 RepID=A0ABU3TK07_9BACT|nr:hypothetical protein [Hymenobacter endophyticus]MDU0371550.1 hypothetical protein [Hymenobacter endophyticus]